MATPLKPSQVSLRTVFTVGFGVAAVAALLVFLWKTRVSLTLSLSAVLLAIALNHAVTSLTGRGLKRVWAIVVVVIGLILVGVGLGLVVIPPLVNQVHALVNEAPQLWDKFRHAGVFTFLNERFDLEAELRESGSTATGAVNPVLAAIGGVLSALAGLVTLVFLAVFMLIFGPELLSKLVSEIAPEHRVRYERGAESIYRSVGGYLGGLMGICSINATLTTAFLAISGMPFFLPLGILSGMSSLVPYVGPLVTGGAVTLLALATGGPWKALATGVYFVLYGQLEGNVLGPLIYRRTAHINPLVTLLAILFMAEFMGIQGAIIAVPAAAALQVIVRELNAMNKEAAVAPK